MDPLFSSESAGKNSGNERMRKKGYWVKIGDNTRQKKRRRRSE